MVENLQILSRELRRISFLFLLLLGGGSLFSQTTSISGISDNEYSAVVDWKIFVSSNPDSVVVAEASKFAPGDYVMLYVTKGLEMDELIGDVEGYRSCIGNYALFIIDKIVGDTVVLNASTGFIDPRDPLDLGTEAQKTGWASQLIKIPVYNNAVVDGNLTSQGWDSISGTGGVLALYVKHKLILNADITMTGKGFAGADPTGDIYGSGCYIDGVNDYNQRNYDVAEMDSAGRKGEGAVRTNEQRTRGKGRMINGGGGGNGKYAGGGGGSNYNIGGNGGEQTTDCGPKEPSTSGEGGFGFTGTHYKNDGGYMNRMWLGGGGGTGTQDPLFPASKGGNGGGIIFIVADTIETNGSHGIYSNGASVTELSQGAGGGGGGGGAILLEVNGYINPIILSAVGGDGGSTGNPGHYTGPGGGGGGGVYWIPVDDPLITEDDFTIPKGGTNAMGTDGTDGTTAEIFEGLSAPLNGLVYNSLPASITVCSDTIPPKIDAAAPKGGDGSTPVITWLQSTDKVNWTLASGINDQEDYVFTSPLLNTMHYTRVVRINALVDSLNTIVTYTVLPKIENNRITVDDDLQCEGILPGIELYPNAVLSGANVSSDTVFSWQMWTKHGDTPVAALNEHNKRSYDLPVLSDTTYFRRIVKSGVCRSVSDTITINVLDAITNNTIASRDTLCNGQSPELLVGGVPGGGDLVNYWFDWEESESFDGPYLSSGVKLKDLDHTDLSYAGNHYFKRTVYSGIDSSCIFISDTFKIEVLDLIGNNNIISDPIQTICQFDVLAEGGLLATEPSGGDSEYTYTWQVSDDKITWGDSLVTNTTERFNLSSFPGTDTLYMRRLVYSGKDDVCQDISDTVTIDIVEAISNNAVTPRAETYCAGDLLPTTIEATTAVSADNEIGIEWQYRFVGASWGPAPGLNSDWNYNYNEVLSDTVYFRRLVWSRKTDPVCTSLTSDSVKIFVQAAIDGNSINMGLDSIKYICYGMDTTLIGSPISGMTGGDNIYGLQWQVESAAGVFEDLTGETGENYSILDFSADKTYRRIVLSGECESISEATEIPVKALPVASLALSTLDDTATCESLVHLDVTIANPESGLDYFVKLIHTPYEAGDSIIGNGSTSLITLDHTPVIPASVTYDSMSYFYELARVVDSRGCVSLDMSGKPKVKVFRKPEAKILSDISAVCGEEITLVGSDKNGAVDAYWEEFYGSTDSVLIENAHVNESRINLNLDVVGYPYDREGIVIGWTVVTPDCRDTDTMRVVFYQLPDSTTLKKESVEFYFDPTYDLSKMVPELDAGHGTWSVDNSGASVSGQIATDFTYELEHKFTWTVSNGVCEDQSDELILIQHDLKQYNAFSPNNDAYNQVFVMPGLINLDPEDSGDSFRFILYNSWGTKVQEVTLKDAKIESVEIDGEYRDEYVLWDGTLRGSGEVAPTGTYYYELSFKYNGTEYPEKTDYIILRR